VGKIQDPSLTEASGLAASESAPGVLWAHNDSGHPPILFCMLVSGASCGSWDVVGADNTDWEDIDIGPGPSSGSYIYVGDIGDNSMNRESVTVYRVPEPKVDPTSASSAAGSVPSVTAEAFELRYPDGPHDAEALLVHPITGDLYIVTKEIESGVYRAPGPLGHDGITTLQRVTRFSIFASFADITGGDISPDGTRVAFATYGGGYELVLPSSTEAGGAMGFDEIWHVTPARVDTGQSGQLEAVTYTPDGMSLLFVPEGRGSPIWRSNLES
jgi:hypothetical protein